MTRFLVFAGLKCLPSEAEDGRYIKKKKVINSTS